MFGELESKVNNHDLEDKLRGLLSNFDQDRHNSIAAMKDLDKIISKMNLAFFRKINHSLKNS